MADFTALEAEVARIKDVDASAIALLDGVAQMVADAVAADNLADDTETAKLAASLKEQTDSLAAKVAEGTPSAPPTV
jgi:hypothetical protein